jgi:hypothetical protein
MILEGDGFGGGEDDKVTLSASVRDERLTT